MTASAMSAAACGGNTVALIESVAAGGEAPLLRCGADFNAMLAHAGGHEWAPALAAYRAHLANLGKWEADGADAKAALAFLEAKAALLPDAKSKP